MEAWIVINYAFCPLNNSNLITSYPSHCRWKSSHYVKRLPTSHYLAKQNLAKLYGKDQNLHPPRHDITTDFQILNNTQLYWPRNTTWSLQCPRSQASINSKKNMDWLANERTWFINRGRSPWAYAQQLPPPSTVLRRTKNEDNKTSGTLIKRPTESQQQRRCIGN